MNRTEVIRQIAACLVGGLPADADQATREELLLGVALAALTILKAAPATRALGPALLATLGERLALADHVVPAYVEPGPEPE